MSEKLIQVTNELFLEYFNNDKIKEAFELSEKTGLLPSEKMLDNYFNKNRYGGGLKRLEVIKYFSNTSFIQNHISILKKNCVYDELKKVSKVYETIFSKDEVKKLYQNADLYDKEDLESLIREPTIDEEKIILQNDINKYGFKEKHIKEYERLEIDFEKNIFDLVVKSNWLHAMGQFDEFKRVEKYFNKKGIFITKNQIKTFLKTHVDMYANRNFYYYNNIVKYFRVKLTKDDVDFDEKVKDYIGVLIANRRDFVKDLNGYLDEIYFLFDYDKKIDDFQEEILTSMIEKNVYVDDICRNIVKYQDSMKIINWKGEKVKEKFNIIKEKLDASEINQEKYHIKKFNEILANQQF